MAVHGLPDPAAVHPCGEKRKTDGTAVWGIAHAGRMTSGRSSAVPLSVEFADELGRAANRRTPSGRDRSTVARDRAFISLLLGTDIRLTPASLLTRYEVSDTPLGPFTPFSIPGAINKYRRAVYGLGSPTAHVTFKCTSSRANVVSLH